MKKDFKADFICTYVPYMYYFHTFNKSSVSMSKLSYFFTYLTYFRILPKLTDDQEDDVNYTLDWS